jgi:ABC-type transport system involved in multi-copper enzyme maturation permease subunit
MTALQKIAAAGDWHKWWSQFRVIAALEFRRNVFTKRGVWIYFLAFAPAFIIAMHGLESMGKRCTMGEDTQILAGIIMFFYVRLGIFFGCLGLFTWLFRGEVVQKSLHYYFLAPVRREILMLGKFAAGVATTVLLFGAGVLFSYMFMYGHFGPAGQNFTLDGPGLGHLRAYLTIVVLACVGYGSAFLALSMVFKNPIPAGTLMFLWETISGAMPAVVQKLSITFYLKNLAPVALPTEGILALFTVVVEPVPAWLAVPGVGLVAAAFLAFACWRIRSMEISYATD